MLEGRDRLKAVSNAALKLSLVAGMCLRYPQACLGYAGMLLGLSTLARFTDARQVSVASELLSDTPNWLYNQLLEAYVYPIVYLPQTITKAYNIVRGQEDTDSINTSDDNDSAPSLQR